MSLYLGIDSATPYLSLSLCSEESILADFCKRLDRNHAKCIIPEIDKLFLQARAAKSELTAIGVGLGPGSYTGLRIGIAVAKGLARALEVPIAGVSTLEAMAASYLTKSEPEVVALLEAHRGNVYAGHYAWVEGGIEQKGLMKVARAELEKNQQLPVIEDVPPKASYLAQKSAVFAEFGKLKPIYL